MEQNNLLVVLVQAFIPTHVDPLFLLLQCFGCRYLQNNDLFPVALNTFDLFMSMLRVLLMHHCMYVSMIVISDEY